MTIKRGGISEPISGNIITKEIPAYCPKCAILHFQSRLQPRVYREDELIAGQLPYDHNQWLQCYNCGVSVPKHDIPNKGELTTDIEPIRSKFSIENVNERLEKPKHRRGFNERIEREDDIKDPEVKKALKKGAKLLSYSEK